MLVHNKILTSYKPLYHTQMTNCTRVLEKYKLFTFVFYLSQITRSQMYIFFSKYMKLILLLEVTVNVVDEDVFESFC